MRQLTLLDTGPSETPWRGVTKPPRATVCVDCGKPPKPGTTLSQGRDRNCYAKALRRGVIFTRPRYSDPLTLPSMPVANLYRRGINGRPCRILVRAFERGFFGYDTYDSVLDAEMGMIGIHRLKFFRVHGWLPEGHDEVIRHRCDRPGCFEERHLFVGPQRGNVVDDSMISLPSINARKTHCHRGHPFDAENTYVYEGGRHCRECQRQANIRWQAKHRP